MELDDSIRRQLILLARRKECRHANFSPDRPTKWKPLTVRNPHGILDSRFTEASAWELIASRLEAGEPVETVTLQYPPGRTGYVMKFRLELDAPFIYVKLQLGSGVIIGRSFHYSRHPPES